MQELSGKRNEILFLIPWLLLRAGKLLFLSLHRESGTIRDKDHGVVSKIEISIESVCSGSRGLASVANCAGEGDV